MTSTRQSNKTDAIEFAGNMAVPFRATSHFSRNLCGCRQSFICVGQHVNRRNYVVSRTMLFCAISRIVCQEIPVFCRVSFYRPPNQMLYGGVISSPPWCDTPPLTSGTLQPLHCIFRRYFKARACHVPVFPGDIGWGEDPFEPVFKRKFFLGGGGGVYRCPSPME